MDLPVNIENNSSLLNTFQNVDREPDVVYNEVNAGPVHHEEIVDAAADAGPSTSANNVSMEDDSTCTICFEPYTSSGNHRMSCLKCGHLFGKKCIERWIQPNGKNSTNGHTYCPTCKEKAKYSDIRTHYCHGAKVVDTSERDEAIKERDREREEKRKLQIELATSRQQHDTVIRNLQKELHQLQQLVSGSGHSRSSQPVSSDVSISDRQKASTVYFPSSTLRKYTVKFESMQKLEICKDGESRVMDYAPRLATLVASSKTTGHLFPGFGLTKVQTELLRCTNFVRIHAQSIRDVKYSQRDALILTASLDKCLKITSGHNDNSVHSWNVNQPLWSCCWKSSESRYLFAGTHNGKVKLYDSRMPALSNSQGENSASISTALDTFDCGNKGVIGLHWIDVISSTNASGLLVSMIDRVIFLEHISAIEFRPHVLLSEHKITSTCFEKGTQHSLITFGPSAVRDKVEHVLQELHYRNISTDPTRIEPSYSSNSVRSFVGGQQQLYMCRNTLFPHPNSNNSLMAVTFDEANDKLKLWDATAGQLITDAPKPYGNFDKMLHIAKYDFSNTPVVAALGSKSLYLYKMVTED